MGTVVKGLFQGRWQPQLMIVRNRSKLNITKPRLPHYERALVEHVCKPYFNIERKPTNVPNYDMCGSEKYQIAEKNLYEDFLAKQLWNWINNSKLIAFLHVNYYSMEEKFQAQVSFKKNGLKYLSYNRKVVKYALQGTIYEPALALFKAHTSILVSQESNLQNLMNAFKTTPKFVLMAAVFENRLLSYSEIQYYSKYKNLEDARSKLVGMLSTSSQNLIQQINHHPCNLVQLLGQHQLLNGDKNSDKTEIPVDK